MDILKTVIASYSDGCYGMLGSPAYTSRMTLKKWWKHCKAWLENC